MAKSFVGRFVVAFKPLLPAPRTFLSSPLLLGVCRATKAPRAFSIAPCRLSPNDDVTVRFLNRDGDTLVAKGKAGESLLDAVVEKNLDIDVIVACEGTLACSTCHLIVNSHVYNKSEPVTDEEMDMQDLACGLTETSRVGSQICLTKEMEGMTVRVPEAVAEARKTVDAENNY